MRILVLHLRQVPKNELSKKKANITVKGRVLGLPYLTKQNKKSKSISKTKGIGWTMSREIGLFSFLTTKITKGNIQPYITKLLKDG